MVNGAVIMLNTKKPIKRTINEIGKNMRGRNVNPIYEIVNGSIKLDERLNIVRMIGNYDIIEN